MSKHTPGPWAADADDMEQDADSVFTISICTAKKSVATVCAFSLLTSADGSVSPTDATESGLEEARSNARLIAAAPDLLEALQAVRDVAWPHLKIEDQDAMDAAIAKATGEGA